MTHLIAKDHERTQGRADQTGEVVIATGAYKRTQRALASVDEYGAGVAHQDLSEAVLRYSGATLLVLSESLPTPASLSAPQGDANASGVAELRERYGANRVQEAAAADLPQLAEINSLLFVAAGTQASHLGQVRYGYRGRPFPICSILHSAHWPNMLLTFANLLLISEPSDCLVATSTAGKRVVETALDAAWEFLQHRLRLPSAARPNVRVEQIPLGVEEEIVRPLDRSESRELLNLPHDATVILYLGRLSEGHKADLEPLLIAFQRLAASDASVLLVIAGQARASTYSGVLMDLTARHGLADRVRFITDFPYCQKSHIYSAADIFVSPVDNIQETYGISIVEAMAAGLPVIASDWSGYRDLVQDGKTGLLVKTAWNAEAADLVSHTPFLEGSHIAEHFLAQRTTVDINQLHAHLQLLVQNHQLRRDLGAAGRARFLADLSWRVLIGKYARLWSEQLGIARRMPEEKRQSAVNYNALFGHYATKTLLHSNTFVCENPPDLAEQINAGQHRTSSNALQREIIEVLARCRSGTAMPLHDNANDFRSPVRADAISWLLKKGMLTAC